MTNLHVDTFDLNDFISTTEVELEDSNQYSNPLPNQTQSYNSLDFEYADYTAKSNHIVMPSLTPPYSEFSPSNESYVKFDSLDSNNIDGSNLNSHSSQSGFLDIEEILSMDWSPMSSSNSQTLGDFSSHTAAIDVFQLANHSGNYNTNITIPHSQRGLILSNELPITPVETPNFNFLSSNPTSNYPTPSPMQPRSMSPSSRDEPLVEKSSNTTTTTTAAAAQPKGPKKLLTSRLSINSLSQVLNIPLEETIELEAYVLAKFTETLHFPLGKKTWIRDTTDLERKTLLSDLYNLCVGAYPHIVTLENLEIIIKRATYSCMQGRLRKERRVSTGVTKKRNNGKKASLARGGSI
ncbi:hypothetical protein WICPIJ_000207 [Wickerhamomyces pijperi]|uniref:Uncharacterized protein n=1 Tax=Wickerhamomyces pijperi TaxID=599730 RepID=A0A9P8QHP2_WICPI|nr:hypothetical protein WICPIJ_000207 [Wickerhamomyces pijperi]